jgi:hypothetical protein
MSLLLSRLRKEASLRHQLVRCKYFTPTAGWHKLAQDESQAEYRRKRAWGQPQISKALEVFRLEQRRRDRMIGWSGKTRPDAEGEKIPYRPNRICSRS